MQDVKFEDIDTNDPALTSDEGAYDLWTMPLNEKWQKWVDSLPSPKEIEQCLKHLSKEEEFEKSESKRLLDKEMKKYKNRPGSYYLKNTFYIF